MTLERLREIDPVPDPPEDPEAAERLLRQLLAQPRRPPRRRGLRVAVAGAAAAALAAGAVALWPSSGGGPDVIARAAAALGDANTILHFTTRWVSDGPRRRHVVTTEEWHSAGGRQQRSVFRFPRGVGETVFDFDAKTEQYYTSARNEIVKSRMNGRPAPGRRMNGPAVGWGGGTDLGGLAYLLDLARNGRGNVHLLGETSVRDVPVHELRVDYTLKLRERRGSKLVTRPVTFHQTLYLDRERFLPVRIVDTSPVHTVTDYFGMERLPRTPENEALLRMAPHPGAKVIER